MSGLRFEWHPAKAAANERKHGVSFEEAASSFLDDQALLIEDPDHSSGEERFVLLGLSAMGRVLVVVHCYRGDSDTIRVISARRAVSGERARYSRGWRQ